VPGQFFDPPYAVLTWQLGFSSRQAFSASGPAIPVPVKYLDPEIASTIELVTLSGGADMDRNGQLGRWAALILGALLFCLLPSSSPAASKAGVQEDIPEGLVLVPRVGLSVEYGGFIVHQDNYASLLHRRLEADMLQYGRHILYLEFDENAFFGTPFDKWDFNLLKYRVTLGGLPLRLRRLVSGGHVQP
jgi:hypothetical protein